MVSADDRKARARAMVLWVQGQLDGLQIPGMRKRQHLGCASLHITIEHTQAIVVLVDEHLEGSALALLRLTFEAFIRGVWILECADDVAIDRAGEDGFPFFGTMLEAVESVPRFDSGGFSALKDGTWATLCSLTHGGTAQTLSRLGLHGIGSDFSDEDRAFALGWAEQFGYLAVSEFAILAGKKEMYEEAVGRLAQH